MTADASMRPGDFSPGNMLLCRRPRDADGRASMRPGDFSPGNLDWETERRWSAARCFNEAGGFLPRKLKHVSHLVEKTTLQ